MHRRSVAVQWILCMVVAFGLCSMAAGQATDGQKKDDQQSVDTTAKKTAPAAATDFKKELNLPFHSLTTLGSRIDTSRRGHDPVGLAHAASELSVAEKVSGKKANITSNTLIKEAAQLAALRKQAEELEAVNHLAQQITAETDLVDSLKKQILLAKDQAKSETDALRRNEEPTDAPRKILVNNYTPQYADVWVNGYLKLQLRPGESKWCVIEHKWNPTVLTATGNEDITHWGPRYVWGNYKTYTWNLH